MLDHLLCLFHVSVQVLLCRETLELLTKLLVRHLHFEHLRVQLHRGVLNAEGGGGLGDSRAELLLLGELGLWGD